MALQGWISLPATQRLFQSAGVDSEKAFAAAKQPGFKATVAKINIDGCAPQSKVSNVIISGYGDTNTDQLVEETAAAQGRYPTGAERRFLISTPNKLPLKI